MYVQYIYYSNGVWFYSDLTLYEIHRVHVLQFGSQGNYINVDVINKPLALFLHA